MPVQSSQVRAVRELLEQRRRGYLDSPVTAPEARKPAVDVRPALRVYEEAARPGVANLGDDLRLALGDLVLSVSALDGAVALEQGPDLRIVASVRGLIARRTLSRDMSPAVWEVLAAGTPLWLADPSSAGIHLPPHAQVLAIPFRAGERRAVALLNFQQRRRFSQSDLGWLAHVLTTAASRDRATPSAAASASFDEPLAA